MGAVWAGKAFLSMVYAGPTPSMPAWLRAIEVFLAGQEDVTIVPNPVQLVRLASIPKVDAADVNGAPEYLCILEGYGTGCPQLEPGLDTQFLFVTLWSIVYLLTYCVPGT